MGPTTIEEQFIRQALQLLAECGTPGTVLDNPEATLGELLIEQLNLLVGHHAEIKQKLEQSRKELGVFRDVSADANRMLEQKIEEISLLRLITDASGRAMQTRDPLRQILGKVVDIVGAENGFIMMCNGDEHHPEIQSDGTSEMLEENAPLFSIARKVAEYSVKAGEPVFVDDVRTEIRFDPPPHETDGVASFAAFPLVIDETIVGVLILSSPHPNAFGAETQRIMLIITGQIAVAIENARLYGEVRKTKEYLEDLVERAGDAIFTLDRDHKILAWNAGAETMFKRSKQEMLGESLYALLPESMLPTLRQKIQSILESENIITIESDLEQENEKMIRVTITLSPIRGGDNGVVGVSGIAKDISKRRQLEDELRNLNDAKSTFVSTVSHELRTPVTSIKSLTEVLSHEMESLSEENVTRYLNIINEECDRLSELISGLLDLQRLNAGKLEADLKTIRLAEIVRRAIELFGEFAAQNEIELTSDFADPDHMTAVMGDRGQLLRILSNLLSNAFKYSNSNGKISIRLSREDENVRLAVTDNGIGISDDEKDKVFDKFYRVDNSATRKEGGSGLGLAITKELVELHNGRIWVEDAQDGGCCFNVLIPAADSATG
jgi:PAS domain S-box-containing protein